MDWWATGLAAFIGLVIFFVIFYAFRTSGYTISNSTLIDLPEFRTFPKELKDFYRNVIVNIYFFKAGNIITNRWNTIPPNERQRILDQMRLQAEQMVAQLNQPIPTYAPPATPTVPTYSPPAAPKVPTPAFRNPFAR